MDSHDQKGETMKKLLIFVSSVTLSAGLGVFLHGCSSSSSSTAATASDRSYAGAGSDWRFTLKGDGSFSGTESETSSTINGTYSTTSTGLIKVTVTSKSGDHTPAVGTVLSGMEIPGFALVFAPILDNEDQLVGTIATGKCPTEDWTNNFINLQFNLSSVDMTKTTGAFNQGSSYEGDLFGTFKWNAAAGTGAPLTHYVVAGYTELFPTSPGISGTCVDGILSTTSFNAYLAPGAGFVKVTETGSPNKGNGIIAMPRYTLGSLSAVDGEYGGFIYDGNSGTATKIRPIKATAAAGSLSIESLSPTDLVTPDGLASGTATLTDYDSPSIGFIKGTIGSAKLICMAGTNILDSGKNALYCLGQNPSDLTKPYMLILGSK
jgi:hypothetical protein